MLSDGCAASLSGTRSGCVRMQRKAQVGALALNCHRHGGARGALGRRLLGRRQPTDEFQGDVNLRTLRALLAKIDEQGFERVRFLQFWRFFLAKFILTPPMLLQSPHQLVPRPLSEPRVIYRQDRATMRPAIMKKNGWPTCPSKSSSRRRGALARCAAPLPLTKEASLPPPLCVRRPFQSQFSPRAWP